MAAIERFRSLKREHPFQYWARLLMVCWWVGTLLMAGFVQAAPTHEKMIVQDHCSYPYQGQKLFARAPNNNWLYVHPGYAEDSLNVSRSSDNGTTWVSENVVDTGWKGQTVINPIGIHSTYNNTTIIVFRTEGADNNYDTYIGIKWNDTGSWEISSLWGDATYDWDWATTAANYSHICIAYTYNDAVRATTWDWINDTVDMDDDALTGAVVNNNVKCTVNVTGDFWVMYRDWDGSYYDFHMRNLDNSVNFMHNNVFNLAQPYPFDFQGLPNGYFYWYFGFKYGANTYIRYNKALWDGTGQSQKTILSTSDTLQYIYGGSCYNTTNYVYLFLFHDTDDELLSYDAAFDATEATWQASKAVIKSIDAGANARGKTSPNMWPRFPNGNYTDIPLTGWAFPWVEYTTPDANHDFWLSWEGEYEWYNWTVEAQPEEPPGDDDDWDIFGLFSWDTVCISNWAILIIVLLLAVVLMGLVGRGL